MADIKSSEERSKNMSAIKSKNTKPEIFLRKLLFANGYRYRIHSNTIPGHPDLWLKKYNTAIFVNGCFWHRHQGCKYAYTPRTRIDFWNRKFEQNIKRDQTVKMEIFNRGIRCLIIWECSIEKALKKTGNPQLLVDKIVIFLHSDNLYQEI